MATTPMAPLQLMKRMVLLNCLHQHQPLHPLLLNSHYITYFDRLTNRKVFRCKKQGAKNCDFLWPGFLDLEIHDNMIHGGQHKFNLWMGPFFHLFCGKDPRYAYICASGPTFFNACLCAVIRYLKLKFNWTGAIEAKEGENWITRPSPQYGIS